jgi:hypothetical protein
MESRLCAQKTLRLFARPFRAAEAVAAAPRRLPLRSLQPARTFCATRRLDAHDGSYTRRLDARDGTYARHGTSTRQRTHFPTETEEEVAERTPQRPAWMAAKAAMKEKLNGEAWNPRKKLSPDTMEGIRHLHQSQPDKFTTPVLAEHFQVSTEAIRRILKSTWQPTDNEYESRMQRWDKRGERIWSNLVEMGIKPPKKWRQMGVGRAERGERPVWKSRRRNQVEVRDSVKESFLPDEDILPTVDESGNSKPKPKPVKSLLDRL